MSFARLSSMMLLLCNLTALFSAVMALSTPQTSRQFIELTNPLKSGSSSSSDLLPASFVSNMPTWVLLLDDDDSSRWTKIPEDGGLVSPVTVDELWQPLDLKSPDLRLAVGFHVRHGQLRHVLPAIDLSYLGGTHRNRGLCSVPRAWQWMDFPAMMAGAVRECSLQLQTRTATDSDEEEWSTLLQLNSIEDSVNKIITALAEEPPEELGDGSSIVHVIICEGDSVVECPKPGNELRVLLLEDDSVVGALQVRVEKTAAGSESEFLPEAYQPLFRDESLRRPAFTESKKRMEKINNNNNIR
jgi:hypothetical protein